MKKRGFKDTKGNRDLAQELGYKYIINEKRKRIFIKISNADLAVLKEIMPD